MKKNHKHFPLIMCTYSQYSVIHHILKIFNKFTNENVLFFCHAKKEKYNRNTFESEPFGLFINCFYEIKVVIFVMVVHHRKSLTE